MNLFKLFGAAAAPTDIGSMFDQVIRRQSPGWTGGMNPTGAMSLGANQRPDQPPVLVKGQPIPADLLRGDQPDTMPSPTGPVNIPARVAEAMKGFALPDVSKYGYSPESQGRVDGAGYLTETPFGRSGGILSGVGQGAGREVNSPTVAPMMMDTIRSNEPIRPMTAGDVPHTNFEAPQKRGILGGIFNDPGMRAAMFRAGATMLGGGSVGDGLMAGADFMDTRRREAAATAKDERDFALRQMMANSEIANADAKTQQGWRGLDLEGQRDVSMDKYRKGQLANEWGIAKMNDGTRRYGYQVEERNNIRTNATSRANNAEDNATSRSNNAQDNATSRANNADSNRTSVTVATIGAGSRGQSEMKPSAVNGILGSILPAMGTFVGDPNLSADTISSNPELYGTLSDAVAEGWRTGGQSGAIAAAKGILSQYDYTDDNSWIPGVGKPEFTRKQGAPAGGGGTPMQGPPAGQPEIRYDKNGRGYIRGPNGEAIPVD